jgi:hypothetical protein
MEARSGGPIPRGSSFHRERPLSFAFDARRPAKFAANSRIQGTPEENKAAVQGSIASFGTYTVDEANKTFTIRFEASTYPNQEGVVQTRPFTITGDELRVKNPAPTAGGPPSELVYRREK